MEVIGAVASIVTLVALAKEISTLTKDLLQGYAHAPKELAQLSSHVSLIVLELECLQRLQHSADLETGLTDEESWMLKQALDTARHSITTLHENCARFLKKTTPLSRRVSWVLFDSKTAEHTLLQNQRTEHHLIFILQIINMCRASRAQAQNTRQIELILEELRGYHDEINARPSLEEECLESTGIVADLENSIAFRHKYTISTISVNEQWRRYVPIDFSWFSSGNDFQAAHEIYLRLPIFTPRSRMAFVFSLSLRRSLGYLPNISILGGGLNCFNIVLVDSEIVEACRRGDIFAVRTLFSQKKAFPNDMSVDSRTLIYYASRSGSTELVRFLIGAGAPVKSNQLFATSFERNTVATRLLLQNGAGLDVLANDGYTVATFIYGKSRPRTPQTELIEILAEKDFPYFNAQESNGWTVMHRAAAWGTGADIQALHRSKASADVRSFRLGWTPIFLSVCFKNIDTLQDLWKCLPEEINRDLRDLRGWNLLHIAVCYDNFEAVKWLLGKDVSVDTRSETTSSFVPPLLRSKSFPPGDLARNCGEEAYTKWAEHLKAAGKDVEVQPSDIDWSQEEVDGFFPLCECCDQWIVQSTS